MNQKGVIALVILAVIAVLVFVGINFTINSEQQIQSKENSIENHSPVIVSSPTSSPSASPSPSSKPTIKPLPATSKVVSGRTVFAYYYAWYSNLPRWLHWVSCSGCTPPNNIYAKYYPTLGAYDSSSDTTLDWHMNWLKMSKVDVILLSYWGANHDFSTDVVVKKILDKAAASGLKVAFLLEPGSVEKHRASITHIINNLTNNGTHKGLYKVVRQAKYGS